MDQIVLTRRNLYDLVWSQSLNALSKKYNISDNGLRKMCFRMNIPIPPRGYWQKPEGVRKRLLKSLPGKYDGVENITLEARSADIQKDPVIIQMKELIADPKLNFKVPLRLGKSDPMIANLKKSLDRGYSYNGFEMNSSVQFDTMVTKENTARTLRIIDTLVKLLKKRGHKLEFNHGTYIIIDKAIIKIKFREKVKRIEIYESFQKYAYQPSGILSIKIGEYAQTREWKDGRRKLEEQLPDILARIEVEGAKKNAAIIERKERLAREAEEKRLEELQIKREKKELSKFKVLLGKAIRYNNTMMIRAYIAMTEEKGQTEGASNVNLSEWLEWARKKADWYDPFIEAKDELLQRVDRDELLYVR